MHSLSWRARLHCCLPCLTTYVNTHTVVYWQWELPLGGVRWLVPTGEPRAADACGVGVQMTLLHAGVSS